MSFKFGHVRQIRRIETTNIIAEENIATHLLRTAGQQIVCKKDPHSAPPLVAPSSKLQTGVSHDAGARLRPAKQVWSNQGLRSVTIWIIEYIYI